MKNTYIYHYIFKGGPYEFVTSGGPHKTAADALDAVRDRVYASDICVLAELWTDVTTPTPICWYTLNNVESPLGKSYLIKERDPLPTQIQKWFNGTPKVMEHKFDTSTYVKIPAVIKPTDLPPKLCVDHAYSGDYEDKTVVVTTPNHCSVCNKPLTWYDIAGLFSGAAYQMRVHQRDLNDEEQLSEMSAASLAAIRAYIKKVHPRHAEHLLNQLLEEIK